MFEGSLLLNEEDCLGGSAGAPTTISSYGPNWATIDAARAAGLRVHNCDHVRISKLIVRGQGGNKQTGIEIANNLDGDQMLSGIEVTSVSITGFRHGLYLHAGNGRSGFQNIILRRITAGYNIVSGINLYWGDHDPAAEFYAFDGVYIGYNHVYQTSGDPQVLTNHTGSGIVVNSADNVVIEHNRAYDNGAQNLSILSGPVGIWAWNCRNTVLQFNESYRNRSNSRSDGGGIDLDGGCQDSVMQYNVTYENDGAGIMVGQFAGARPMSNITVRYNLSVNDGRRNRYGGLHMFKARNADLNGVYFYNNTVYMSPGNEHAAAFAIHHDFTDGAVDVLVANNLFITRGGAHLVDVSAPNNDISFVGNNYDSSGEAFQIVYLGETYTSLSAWRSATGQERLSGNATGLATAAQLVAAGSTDAADYQLRNVSSLINAGLDMQSVFGIDPGKQDLFGNPLPGYGAFDVGMHEFPEPAAASPTPTLTPDSTATAIPTATPHSPASTPDPRNHFLYLPVNLR